MYVLLTTWQKILGIKIPEVAKKKKIARERKRNDTRR